MESFQEREGSRRRVSTLAERLQKLEDSKKFSERSKETKEKTKQFNFPFKWRRAFKNSTKKINDDKLLVIFLNKKNEIEMPKFMPIFDGNMVIWKNKPYEFDPRAIWSIKGVKGNPRCYLIKEIDRKPVRNKFGKVVYSDAAVSNLDIDEVRARGDSTESDEFLIKAALKAQTSQVKKQQITWAGIIILLIIVGGVVWFLFKG